MPSLTNWIPSLFRGADSTYREYQRNLARASSEPVPPRERYAVQRAYYGSNGLYDTLARSLHEAGIRHRAVRAIRNPAYRIVEFYPRTLWPGDLPGALPIVTENERIVPAIEQVWSWSNWAAKKQVMARWLPMLGDCFIKVVRPAERPRVYFELVDPAYVCDFETDERGFLTDCRIDVPRCRKTGRQEERYTHTEHWSKELQLYRRWEHQQAEDTPIEELGPPLEEIPFARMGIDFVPIVHAKHLDVGEDRGIGAFWLQLDKIDEVNAEATRLAQLLFRHGGPLMALKRTGPGPDGRVLQRARLAQPSGNGVGQDDDDTIRVGSDGFLSLPGNTEVEQLVANLPYEAHRLTIADAIADLEKDCPEMAYWRTLEDQSAESGRAIALRLGPAISLALEVRGNAEDALARADMMALTIGQAAPALPGFQGLGTFDEGALEHTFEERPVLAPDELDKWTAEQAKANALKAYKEAGLPDAQVLKIAEYTDEEAEEILNQMAGQEDPEAIIPEQEQ
jgi:hypothetical protein